MVPPQTGQFQSGTGMGEVCAASIWGQSSAVEQVEAERQEGSAVPVGEKAEVADAHEAPREQVEEEAAQELIDGQGHEPLLGQEWLF